MSDKGVNPLELSLEQLNAFRTQMEEELKEMGRQLEALSGAKSRFISARNSLDDMNNNTKTDQPLLVPLSSSLYVPGKIDNPNKVIVELGTGYYVEKTVAEAKDLIDRKMQLVNKSIDSIEAVGKNKQKEMEGLQEIMRYKIAMINNSKAAAK